MKKLESISQMLEYPEVKLWVLAENIRSAYNIGAMFRTADGTGKTGLILAGYSPTPENSKVKKTSLGAEENIPWVSSRETIEICNQIRTLLGFPILGLEIVSSARNIFTFELPASPIVLCVGNEVEGLSSELMQCVDHFLFIPMHGNKQSLNVAEATSIAMYEIYRKLTV